MKTKKAKSKGGRPPLQRGASREQVQTSMPPELRRRIDEAAEAAGMTRSAWIREAAEIRLAATAPATNSGSPAGD